MSAFTSREQETEREKAQPQSSEANAVTPTFIVLGWDVIHLLYNLFYPAVLGAFIYNLVIDLLPGANHLFPQFVPQITEHQASIDSACATACLIVTFSVDFLLAKKLYVKFGRKFNHVIARLAAMETLLVVFVAFAFASCHDAKVAWGSYFFWLLCAVALISGFYFEMGRALGKPSIDGTIARTLWWSLGAMGLFCAGGLCLSDINPWLPRVMSALVALSTVVYFSISMRKTALGYPLSISGGNLNSEPE